MSIQSKSPSVYQYGAQPYPSFPTTPFLSKPINQKSYSPVSINHKPLVPYTPIDYRNPRFNTYSDPSFQFYHINPHVIVNQKVRSAQPLVQNTSQPIQPLPNNTQNRIELEVEEDRYDDYLNESTQYKYNLFSIIDQPWNNCINSQQCTDIPNNECIAKPNYKKYWY